MRTMHYEALLDLCNASNIYNQTNKRSSREDQNGLNQMIWHLKISKYKMPTLQIKMIHLQSKHMATSE